MSLDKKVKEYNELNAQLMEEWMLKHSVKEGVLGFAKDGIVSPSKWFILESNEEKILVLLKEAYDDLQRVWDEAKWIMHDHCMENCPDDCMTCRATGTTFNPISEWIGGITGIESGSKKEYDNWLWTEGRSLDTYYKTRDEFLSRIAIMNIKKSNGTHTSSYEDLSSYALNDMDLLRKQIIEVIKPTLIICGGTYDLLRIVFPQLPALDNSLNGVATIDGMKIIAAYHPMAPIKGGNAVKYAQVLENYEKLINLK